MTLHRDNIHDRTPEMSNAWAIGTTPLCNALKSSKNKKSSSCGRVLASFFALGSGKRSIYQLSQYSTRHQGEKCSRNQKETLGSWSLGNIKELYRPAPSSFRLFTNSTPNAYARDRYTTRSSSRNERTPGPSPIWERFSPSAGVPLDSGRLPPSFITSIFGDSLSTEEGNLVLRRLQHRRLSGALAHEPLDYLFPSSAEPIELAEKGLQYLRETYPLDEQARADQYAETEATKAEAAILHRAQRLGLYKRDEEPQQSPSRSIRQRPGRRNNSSSQGQATEQDPVYGESVLERVRRAKEARNREEAARVEATSAQTRALSNPSSNTRISDPSERKPSPWVERWIRRAQISSAAEAPDISAIQRIGPSLALFCVLVAGCLVYAATYNPPARESRLFPNTPTALATVGALVAVNAAVFIAWRIPPCWPLLNRYFVLVPGYPISGSLLGNVFSHQSVAHLAVNMLMLALLGTRLHEGVGRAAFLALYLSAGTAGGIASLTYYTLTRNLTTSSVGASGAVAGVLAAVCLLQTQPPVGARESGGGGLFGGSGESRSWVETLVPMPGVLLLMAMITVDLVGLRTRRQPVDHVAHLGGYAAGMVGAWMLNRRFTKEAKAGGEIEKKGQENDTMVKK